MTKRILIEVDYDTFLSLPFDSIRILQKAEFIKKEGWGDTTTFTRIQKAHGILYIDEALILEEKPVEVIEPAPVPEDTLGFNPSTDLEPL